jgi:hypothetical protein
LAEDDEYELLPRQELEELRKEIERLKKNPLGNMKEGESLLDAINNLNSNIRWLIDIFSKAGEDLQKEYSGRNPVDDIKTIKQQNEDIAQGLIAVADIIKDMRSGPSPSDIIRGPRIPVVMPGSQMRTSPYPPQPFPDDPFKDDFASQIPPPPGQPFQPITAFPGTRDSPLPPPPPDDIKPLTTGQQDRKYRTLFGRR